METEYTRLNTQQWEVIKEFLPLQRKRTYNLRAIVDGIFWLLRTGSHRNACRWRNLPKSYPKWTSVYYYFRKWQTDNTLERLNSCLNQYYRKKKGKKETPSLLSIDSQSVKAAPLISKEMGIDGNKKMNGRKRHVITDTLGLVWGVVVGAANEADGIVAERVVNPLLGYLDRMKKILADQAYKNRFMEWVEKNTQELEVEISSRPPSTQGFVPVKWRWVTERTFGTFNFFRRLSKDYEKTPKSQEAWVLWQNCQIILNRLDRL